MNEREPGERPEPPKTAREIADEWIEKIRERNHLKTKYRKEATK